MYERDEFDSSDNGKSDDEEEDESFVDIHRSGLAQNEGSPPPQAKTIHFEDVDDTNEGLVEMVSTTSPIIKDEANWISVVKDDILEQ